MPRKRTQPQITNLARAWRYLAEQVAAHYRTDMTVIFLCNALALDIEVDTQRIDRAVREVMTEQIKEDLHLSRRGTYSDHCDYDDSDPTGNRARVLRCLMFALEAEDTATQVSAA